MPEGMNVEVAHNSSRKRPARTAGAGMSWLRWWRSRSWRSSVGRAGRSSYSGAGRRAMPVAFGWHQYVCLPGSHRARWRLPQPMAAPTNALVERIGALRRAGRCFNSDLQVDAGPTPKERPCRRSSRTTRSSATPGTVAAVARNGSIDWWCVPRDRLGCRVRRTARRARHGRWCVAPKGDVHRHPSQLRGRLTRAEDRVRHRRRNGEGDRLHVTRR